MPQPPSIFMSTNQTQCVYVIWHYGQEGSLTHIAAQDEGFMVQGASEKNEVSVRDERLKREAGWILCFGFDHLDTTSRLK